MFDFGIIFAQACRKDEAHNEVDMVTMVLRVFVDAYPHIPEHRKLMIFTTLLRVAGIEHYMWRLLLVFIEGVAVQTKTSIAEPATEKEKVREGLNAQGADECINKCTLLLLNHGF